MKEGSLQVIKKVWLFHKVIKVGTEKLGGLCLLGQTSVI